MHQLKEIVRVGKSKTQSYAVYKKKKKKKNLL